MSAPEQSKTESKTESKPAKDGDLLSLSSLLRQVRVGEETVYDVKEGALAVTLRRLQPEAPMPPIRRESPARAHTFHTGQGLADYLKAFHQHINGDDPALMLACVYVDLPGERVHVVGDEAAEYGHEILTMQPQVHARWKPWHALFASHGTTIRDFAQFIMLRRRDISAPDGRELAMTFSQVQATTTIEVQRGRGKSATNGVLVTHEIKGQEHETFVDLPETIKLRVPLYVGAPAVDLEVDLTLEADREDVRVTATCANLDEAKQQAFDALCAPLTEAVKAIGGVLVHGRPQHEPWSYLT